MTAHVCNLISSRKSLSVAQQPLAIPPQAAQSTFQMVAQTSGLAGAVSPRLGQARPAAVARWLLVVALLVVVMIAVVVILMNLIADLLYALLDPRVSHA